MYSAAQALRDPNVWAPVAAAVALQAGDLDEQISDQLRENTPLFGSSENALDASDDLRSASELAYISTALLAPAPTASSEWLLTKARLLGSELLSAELAGNLTTRIQHYTDREKPNQRNSNSMPSYHVTTTTFNAGLAQLNTGYLPISESSQQALNYSYDAIAGLTAWARVEAGEHYPSDVLAGWALAHFLGYIANDFIVPEAGQEQLQVKPYLTSDTTGVEFAFRF